MARTHSVNVSWLGVVGGKAWRMSACQPMRMPDPLLEVRELTPSLRTNQWPPVTPLAKKELHTSAFTASIDEKQHLEIQKESRKVYWSSCNNFLTELPFRGIKNVWISQRADIIHHFDGNFDCPKGPFLSLCKWPWVVVLLRVYGSM